MWWKRKQQDFSAEIQAHLELEADQLCSEGLTPADAQAAARRAFGNRLASEERFYESGRWMFWDHLRRDVRLAARVLRKDARFSGLAALGLALGLGVSTAIFAIVNAIHRAGLAQVQDPASYVELESKGDDGFSYSEFRYYRDRATAFRTVAAESYRDRFILGPFSNGKAGAEAEEVEGRFVSANFLSARGLTPFLGRSFSAEEEQVGGPPVALVNFGCWKRRFAADAGVAVGKTIVLNARALTVIGIADARFETYDRSSFYLPLALQPVLLDGADPEKRWLMLSARLQGGVTARQAQAEVDVLASAVPLTKPANPEARHVLVISEAANPKRRSFVVGTLALILAVSMILLIACSNLANLLFARAVVRRREIGVRLCLGASRARLVCQLLTESVLLAMLGGAFGLLFSDWLATALVAFVPNMPGFELHFDPRVILYGMGLSLATALSFGLAPAMAATKTTLAQALHSEGLSGTTRSASQRIWSPRNLLVIVPLAVSLMLLIGAGMNLRYLHGIYLSGPAFDTSHLIGMSSPLNIQGYDEARTRQFQENLTERIGRIPAVTSIALAGGMPLSDHMGRAPLLVEGSVPPPGRSAPRVSYNVVSPNFFGTLGVPIVRGRAFTTSDREGSPPVAMVSQFLARTFWPNEEPLGKRLRLESGSTFFEVVGVVPDLQNGIGPGAGIRPLVYVPYRQAKLFLTGSRAGVPFYQMQFLIRTSSDPAGAKAVLRQLALATDSSLLVNIQTLEEMLESKIGLLKTNSFLLGALGALALVMASVGIYAILAYAVSQRTREIGIRMALGAQPREVLALVMQRTVVLIAWGIGLGLIGGLALDRVLSSAVGLMGFDALTCIFPALLLGLVALLASYLPARKALRVDPMQSLRFE